MNQTSSRYPNARNRVDQSYVLNAWIDSLRNPTGLIKKKGEKFFHVFSLRG